jgi:hypothetical protein
MCRVTSTQEALLTKYRSPDAKWRHPVERPCNCHPVGPRVLSAPAILSYSGKLHLPLAGHAAVLDLAQSLGTAEEGDGADSTEDWQGGEEVPAQVVHVEDALETE